MIGRVDLEGALERLADAEHCRPAFHSEGDFRFELACELHSLHPNIQVRAEHSIRINGKRRHIDIWLQERDSDAVVAVEVKYLPKDSRYYVEAADEKFVLSPATPDQARYDCWKDVARL